jgi:cytochrome c5
MRRLLLAIGLLAGGLFAGAGTADAQGVDGKQVYAKACAVCHNALPPKLGDKSAWSARVTQGVDALVAAVIKGKGTMPPKAGNASLTEAEIRAATEYIVAQSR